MTDKIKNLISTPLETKKILKKYNLFAKKSLGQNFLVDSLIAQNIVSALEIEPDDYVIEIGPGLGGLSQLIFEQTNHLSLLEIDNKLADFLQQLFNQEEKPEIIRADALKFDFPAYIKGKGFSSYKVIANLPYYITTPILMHLLEEGGPWQSMVLMMQKEVADRLMAAPGGKECGAISLSVQYRATVEEIISVPPTSFIPQPKVESKVIRLKRLETPPVMAKDEKSLFLLIKAGFGQRRKTLSNALSNSGLADKLFWQQAFMACDIDGNRRGETLSLEEYARLADWYFEMANK